MMEIIDIAVEVHRLPITVLAINQRITRDFKLEIMIGAEDISQVIHIYIVCSSHSIQ